MADLEGKVKKGKYSIPSILIYDSEKSQRFSNDDQEFSKSHLPRYKIIMNNLKKVNLAVSYQEKVNSSTILEKRRKQLKKYCVDYIPLCFDEDYEAMASAISKNQKR